MAEPSRQTRTWQWNWVAISLVFYLLFYLLPLYLASMVFPHNLTIPGVWMFAGVIIIAAFSGYLSKGVTIWEPAIAGAGLVLLFIAYHVLFVFRNMPTDAILGALIWPTVIVFGLSILGAWLGERAQRLFKSQSTQSS
jgi:peptidoglycan/LPS O-acetylase OafA/YrhL